MRFRIPYGLFDFFPLGAVVDRPGVFPLVLGTTVGVRCDGGGRRRLGHFVLSHDYTHAVSH